MAYFFPAPFDEQAAYFRRSVRGLNEGGAWAGAYLDDVIMALLAVEVAATRDRTPRSEVDVFRREAAEALTPLAARVRDYVETTADEAVDADEDAWEALCAKRSAIEILRTRYMSSAATADVNQDDLERLDRELRRLGDAHGPVRPEFRLPGMPSCHAWWWCPGAPPAEAVVEKALQMTDDRLARVPEGNRVHAMLVSVQNQLVFMRDTIARGRAPTTAEKNSLTLHVIAVREFETDDPLHCDALSRAAYAFKNL